MAPEPNEPIVLYEGRIRVRDDLGSASEGPGSIFLAWQPTPRIRFRVRVPTLFTRSPIAVEFASSRRRAAGSVLVTLTQVGTDRGYVETVLDGFFTKELEVGSGRGLAFVTFEIPNFPEIDGRLDSSIGRWGIEIARSGSTTTFRTLRQEGGYALTGTGRIRRVDGRSFGGRSIMNVLNSLAAFLSFASGTWSQPILLVGYDAAGRAVWNRWEVLRTSRWDYRPHWLPRRSQQHAMDLFAAWHGRWTNPYWKEVLQRVTYFFVDANRSVVDIGLVAAQSGLETLSYAISVVDKKSITASAFDSPAHKAHMKIRGLLADSSIPSPVPFSLPALSAFVHSSGVADGPGKITWLRNRLVHPLKSARTSNYSAEMVEAWRLALWYIEASLLGLLGYEGSVWSRVSQVEEPFA